MRFPPADAESVSNAPNGLPDDVSQPRQAIDAHMQRYVRSLGMPANLTEAIEYALLAPGKRIRPLLAWHSAAAVGAEPADCVLPSATAVELIHAFSLVHDDLPALDDDDLRRGRPTLHTRDDLGGQAMAILAGDCMLTLAFRVINDDTTCVRAASALSSELAGATSSMIVGQVYDLLGNLPAKLSDQQKLELIHTNKTGALIRAACRMGAIAGLHSLDAHRADHPSLAAINAFSTTLGLLFQVIDDVLDVTQSTDQLGKRAGKDEQAGKLTYPSVLGVEASRELVLTLRSLALDELAPLPASADPLRHLADYVATRTK